MNKSIYQPRPEGEPIAIIGMSCTLPGGCDTPETFHDFLLKRKCGIREIPDDRWGMDVFYDPFPDSIAKSVSKWGGFIDEIRGFDAKFFDISPREAQGMDPQQRLVLQAAVNAIFDSGIPFEDYSRVATGVFIGVAQSEYRTLQEMRVTATETFAGTGYALCINANRISHRLNLTGPSYAVDTACSSSLVAMHQAVANLRNGTCEMAIVGGVNAMAHPSPFIAFSKAGMISPTGTVSTFDAAANGFVRGEGVGMIVLKPLYRAQADGDRIHGIIRGTASNQDGATNTITAPSQQAQINMLRNLFATSGIAAGDIGFVEAHGTGTPIGDPIEAGAIGTVIGRASVNAPLWIGSAKANVGHLEAGAGITGLIKATMAAKTGMIPPNINFSNPNPYIPFDALNLRVATKPEAFPETEGRRLGVVNSFGFGGTNACVLIESPPETEITHHPIPAAMASVIEDSKVNSPVLVPLSGATPEAVETNADALLKALGKRGALADVPLQELAAALAFQRGHLRHRTVILARSMRGLKRALRKLAKGEEDIPEVVRGQTGALGKICFTFSGQGSQWWAMARNLLTEDATFANALEAFDSHFKKVAGWSIKAELLKDAESSRIDDTTVTQPALFAIQSGLAAVWHRFGVEPDMVVGHSIGEAAASYLAGGLSLPGAATFLSKRGTIRDHLNAHGSMAAIGLNHEDVTQLLPEDGSLGIAAINGPGSTTISGDKDALQDFIEDFRLYHKDTFIRELRVDTAWHSHQLDTGEAWFRKEMAQIDWSVPEIPFISTVTARPETRFDTDYGWQNLRQPVNFQGAVETAIRMGATTFLELGPGGTLAGPTRSTALEKGATVNAFASLDRKSNDFDAISLTLARLFVEGRALNWATITGKPTRRLDLPGYAWDNEPFWQDSEESRGRLFYRINHPFLGQREYGNGTSFTSEINLRAYPFLKDHCLQSDIIFPAAGYIETMVAVCRELAEPGKVIEFEDAVIHEALFIGAEDELLISTIYHPNVGRLKLYTRVRDAEEDWVLRCEGKVRFIDMKATPAKPFGTTGKGIMAVERDYAYDQEAMARAVNYGPAFQSIEDLWLGRSKTIARIALQDDARQGADRFHIHPTLLDGCLQVMQPRMNQRRYNAGPGGKDPICLPLGAGRIRIYADFPDEVFVEATQHKGVVTDDASGAFIVRDVEGRVLMDVEQLRVRVMPSAESGTDPSDKPAHLVRQVLTALKDNPEDAVSDGTWVLLESGSEVDGRLERALKSEGAKVETLARAELGNDPAGELTNLLASRIEAGTIAGLVVAWPLGLAPYDADTQTDVLFDQLNNITKDMIALADMLDFARTSELGLPEVVFLTSGAYPSKEDGAGAEILTQMPMAALVRGIATETSEYKMRVIDSDESSLKRPSDLARRILTSSPETEIILRDGTVLAPRLVQAEPSDFDSRYLTISEARSNINFHVSMTKPGMIDDVDLFEIPMAQPDAGQISVKVAAVGLNFRDIMAVTGLLPSEAESEPAWKNLGLEFSGVVTTVGEDVDNLKPGDRVMGFAKRCLQRVLVTEATAVTPVPEGISLAEAATVPSAFATAHYALNHVGRMRAGEKVFIHVATGGVGMAAVQLAKAAGAEIFATAGSAQKRRLLKEMGVHHVMNSRTLKFADDVMRITKGQGVDLLLNSLPGDYLHKGLQIMAPYGRFLEIGKVDIYQDSAIGMKSLRRNVSFSALDLAALGEDRPDMLRQVFEELSDELVQGTLQPLPYTEFPVAEAGAAFRYMSQAKHTGKIVITLDAPNYVVRRDEARPVRLSPSNSYLVTGGTGGFGLSMADWLSRAGAGRLILASRSGTIAPANKRTVTKMEARGTQIAVLALDITDTKAVNAFVAEAVLANKPLSGVMHAAAVIQDAFASQMTPEMVQNVLSPKIRGAWNLHRAFVDAGIEADLFIGFSSISQVLGSAGQANYIVGNAFLDAIAYYRRSLGLRGAAIDWGVIGDAGFVARNANLASYLESVGMYGLTAKDTGAAMELALAREAPSFVLARAEWSKVARANQALGDSPRLTSVLDASGSHFGGVRARLLHLEEDELIDACQEFITEEVASVLKVDAKKIQVERPMSELGLDSLSSFELKIRIETALDTVLPISKFLQAPSIAQLAQMLAKEVEAVRRAEAAAQEASEDTASARHAKAQTAVQRASNAQMGLVADATSPLSSDMARRAMEHVVDVRPENKVTLSEVKKVMGRLTRRHALLRMEPVQGPELRLAGDGPKVVEGESDAPLALHTGETLRVSLLPDCTLRLRMHQVLGDAASSKLLAEELLGLLAGKKLPKPLPRSKLLAAVASCGFDEEEGAGKTDRAFWWYSLSDALAPVSFARRSRALLPSGTGHNRGPADHLMGKVVAADEPTTLEAFVAALRVDTENAGDLIMARHSSLRPSLPDAPAIGPFDLIQPVCVPEWPASNQARANLRRVLAQARDHTAFDSHAAARSFGEVFSAKGVTPFQIGVSYDTNLASPAPEAILYDIWLQVAAGKEGHSAYRLIYDQDVVSKETAQTVAKAFEASLERSDKAASRTGPLAKEVG